MVIDCERHGTTGEPSSRSDEGECLVVIQTSSAEVTILQADIDVFADRIIGPRDKLPRPGMIRIAEFLDARAAEAAADKTAESAVAAEIQKPVQHERPDLRRTVKIEVLIGQR